MSDQPVRTRLALQSGEEVSFQEYFVAMRHSVAVSAIRFDGAERAQPAPGVLGAIASARAVVVCPSNPFLSIAPIRAVPGIEEALAARRDSCVSISPIVGGKAIKGPAGRLLAELGHEPAASAVARLYASISSVLVVDRSDEGEGPAITAAGMRWLAADSVMSTPQVAAQLANAAMAAVQA